MLNDEKKLSLELYKELGLEVRQLGLETYATNRLMLPPLVIGLLVLYGAVEKFLGGQVAISRDALCLIWFGCALISLIWICNMSRLAQLSHWHLETQRRCECTLELIGHRKVFNNDKQYAPRILRHSALRFIGFGIYFFLLLNFILRYMDFHKVLSVLKSTFCSQEALILGISIIVSGGLSYLIWYFYLKKPFPESTKTPIKWRCIFSRLRIFLVFLILASLILVIVSFLVCLQTQPDANAYLIRGLRHYAKGNYEDANEAYKKAIDLDSDYAPAYALRGIEHSAKGDDEQSNVDWTKAKALRKAQ